MNAQRRIHEIVLLRQPNAAVHLLGAIAVADSNDSLDSSIARAGNDLLAIGVELFAVKMRVRIYKHRGSCRIAASAVRPERSSAVPISTSPPPAHPLRIPPTPASHPRAPPPQSFHWTPARAVCVAQDWPRSPLSVRSGFPARMLRRSLPALAALRFQYQSPAATACLPWVLFRRLSPLRHAVRSWRSRRSKFFRSLLEPPPQLLPLELPAARLFVPARRPGPLRPPSLFAPLPSFASFQSRSCRRAETQVVSRPVSCPKAVVP